MPRPGQYLIRGDAVVIHDAVATLPAPLSSAEPNFPATALRHERYVVVISADGAQQLTDPVLWAHASGSVERLLGQPNGGAAIIVDEGRNASFDVDGGDFRGLYLQATLESGALVTVSVYPLFREE